MEKRYSGLVLQSTELGEGDIIAFDYHDPFEEDERGTCTGIVCFENGSFVVKQDGHIYDWAWPDTEPATLYQWINDHRCYIVKLKTD